MLDDFKAVLQRLGALKLTGNMDAMHTNSLNIIPNEKAGAVDDDCERSEVRDPQLSRTGHNERRSFSGRELDDGETLDEAGRSRRKESMASSGVGRFGMKIKRLGDFANLKRNAEKQARQNMQRNKKMGSTGGYTHTDSDLGRAPTESQSKESFDFITSALDTSPNASEQHTTR